MTDNSPSAPSSVADRLRHPAVVLVLGALLIAILAFLAGTIATGYRAERWGYGPGVHMNGYNSGYRYPGGMMGWGPADGGYGYPGGMMGWGPDGGPNTERGGVVQTDAGRVKSISGNTVTLTNGAKVKLTRNTYIVVHTQVSK